MVWTFTSIHSSLAVARCKIWANWGACKVCRLRVRSEPHCEGADARSKLTGDVLDQFPAVRSAASLHSMRE